MPTCDENNHTLSSLMSFKKVSMKAAKISATKINNLITNPNKLKHIRLYYRSADKNLITCAVRLQVLQQLFHEIKVYIR